MKVTANTRTRWILAAALAALPAVVISSSALAQTQQPANGRALDANNRIGSGGTNTYRPPPSVGTYGNEVVNGNVRNGASFRGNVGYSDPNEFRGFTVGRATDNFIKDSTQIGVGYTAPPVINSKDAYYGEARFAPPAQPGFVQSKTQPGFVAAQPIVVEPNDARLGTPLEATNTVLPRPGELILPGPIDAASNQQTVLTASPLTGIRQWNPSDVNDVNFLNRFQNMNPLERANMSVNDLQRMRNELRLGPQLPNGAVPIQEQNNSLNPNGPVTPLPQGQIQSQPISAFENPNNRSISAQPMTSGFTVNPITGNLATDQGFSNRVLGAPQQQSTQYDELKKRLERLQTDKKDPARASAQAFNDAMRKKEADAAKTAAKNATATKDPTRTPTGIGTTPDTGTTPGLGSTIKEPVKTPPPTIKSIGAGMQSKGLTEMLDKADAMMKEGKFTSAIDQYAAAEAVAPNQPLVWIGRANAELGASYYTRAEIHLKQAFNADQALLMARYDLRTFLGEERLQSVVKDLKDIASSDQQSPTPVFLLAYIAYNTGNERRAAGYIDLAEKRSGGKDALYKTLREHWSLPTTQEGDEKKDSNLPDINK